MMMRISYIDVYLAERGQNGDAALRVPKIDEGLQRHMEKRKRRQWGLTRASF